MVVYLAVIKQLKRNLKPITSNEINKPNVMINLYRYLCFIMLSSAFLMLTIDVYATSSFSKTGNLEVVAETITGTVRDANGLSLPGVTVLLRGTTVGTVTDNNGNYTLEVPGSTGTLEFSFIGFATKEVPFNGSGIVDVTLEEDIRGLEEVVVVGYGTQRKTDVTGAVSAISTREFAEQPITRIDQVLQGRAAGVQVTQAGGAPGGDVRVRIRGANSVLGNNDPLYVVDGFVGADFNTVNPNDIETIQVLKDAASTSIYGSRGANGVVIITTKK